MASPKSAGSRTARPSRASASAAPLAQAMRELEGLARSFEAGLLQSLHFATSPPSSAPVDLDAREQVRREARRLAVAELSTRYTRKYIRRSLSDAEREGRRLEDCLHRRERNTTRPASARPLHRIHSGYFRLYSAQLFDLLGQPTDLRFGTLRFHTNHACTARETDHEDMLLLSSAPPSSLQVTAEIALNSSYFIADSLETQPYHTFCLPDAPSLQNRGLLSRKPEDQGLFPDFDSWLLFTFLGSGCIKLEVPIEMCADIYGDQLLGRENEEVLFWGFFIDDATD